MTSRRPPPPFRIVEVAHTEPLTPHLMRVVLEGDTLDDFPMPEPAASVRLLLPTDAGLVIPTWNGNEFLLPDGSRPPIRTFTPRRFDPDARRLEIDVVLHQGGAASSWAPTTRPGDKVAISGPGRGYQIDHDAPAYLLVGDETAIPAIAQLLESLPDVPVTVHIEIRNPAETPPMPDHPSANVTWHKAGTTPGEAMVGAVERSELLPDTRVWAAGEAAAVQQLRRIATERGVPRSHATIRGYWKRRG